MVSVAAGLGLGGAQKAFQASDERAIQREAIVRTFFRTLRGTALRVASADNIPL